MTTSFKQDTAGHVMTIENDTGVHRCIYFGIPGTGTYSFRLITWPGHLSISGDMGDYTFARVPDMFDLFRSDVCRRYLEEKLVATCTRSGHRTFNWKHFADAVLRNFDGDDDRVEVELLLRDCTEKDEHGAIELARNWPFDAPRIEWSDMGNAFEGKPAYHFLWCLEAIVWGIAQYDSFKATQQKKYLGVEVEGCVEIDGDIVRSIHCGKQPEFWTVYLRDSEGFASAVSDTLTQEHADHLAEVLENGLKAMNLL